MDKKFRLAQTRDLISINEIYNQSIEQRHQTADLTTYSIEQTHEWYGAHNTVKYPVFVLEINSKVVGWSSLSSYRSGRQALAKVAEISYYVDQSFLRQGHGNSLMHDTMSMANEYSFEILVAILLDTNLASKSILRKFRFSEWGRIPCAAIIDGQKVDHLYFGLQL